MSSSTAHASRVSPSSTTTRTRPLARLKPVASSEVAPSLEAVGGLGSGELVERHARWGPGRVSSAPGPCGISRERQPQGAAFQLGDGLIEVRNAVDEDGPVAREVTREQQRRRIRAQAHHRHACPECLNREHQLRTQSVGERLHLGRHVAAGEVDEIEPVEHGRRQLRTVRAQAAEAASASSRGRRRTSAIPASNASDAPGTPRRALNGTMLAAAKSLTRARWATAIRERLGERLRHGDAHQPPCGRKPDCPRRTEPPHPRATRKGPCTGATLARTPDEH